MSDGAISKFNANNFILYFCAYYLKRVQSIKQYLLFLFVVRVVFQKHITIILRVVSFFFWTVYFYKSVKSEAFSYFLIQASWEKSKSPNMFTNIWSEHLDLFVIKKSPAIAYKLFSVWFIDIIAIINRLEQPLNKIMSIVQLQHISACPQ